MRFLYDNLVDDIAIASVTPASEAAFFPVDNLQDYRAAKTYRTTAVTAQSIVFDFGSGTTVTADSLAIINHNMSTSATITIDASTTDVWPSSTGTVTVTARSSGTIITTFFTSRTRRYWRLGFEDTTVTDGYLEMGRVFLGQYLAAAPNADTSFTVSQQRNDIVNTGFGRQVFGTKGYGWREFSFSFPTSYPTTVSAIRTMYEDCGNWKPLVFCNFNSDYNYPIVHPCYCVIKDSVDFNHMKHQRYAYGLNLVEVR